MNMIKILLAIRLVLPFFLKVFKICKDGVITREELHEIADEIVDELPPKGKDIVLPWGHPFLKKPKNNVASNQSKSDEKKKGNFTL